MVFIPNDGATNQQSSYQYTGCVMAVEAVGSGLPEVLVPNAIVMANAEHPYVKRLVARGILVKNISSCQPTSLSFVPKVILPESYDCVVLRAVLEVNGELVFNYNNNVGFADIYLTRTEISFADSPEAIANYLFLESGVDLMRQMGVREHFDYDPWGGLAPNQPITIQGRSDDISKLPTNDYWQYTVQPINLTLKVIDNLRDNCVDFVKVQWGHDVTVHSCMTATHMGV